MFFTVVLFLYCAHHLFGLSRETHTSIYRTLPFCDFVLYPQGWNSTRLRLLLHHVFEKKPGSVYRSHGLWEEPFAQMRAKRNTWTIYNVGPSHLIFVGFSHHLTIFLQLPQSQCTVGLNQLWTAWFWRIQTLIFWDLGRASRGDRFT